LFKFVKLQVYKYKIKSKHKNKDLMEDLENAIKKLKGIIKSWKKSNAPEQVLGQLFLRLTLINS